MGFDLDSYQPIPVVYELRYMMLKKLSEGIDPLPEIQGREETKRDVIRAVLSNSYPYLVSREGTGKTRLAESLAKLLPPIPKIKNCPYNCDPKWPKEWLCPVCRKEEDPEIEFISGKERYSRIQGNEYTNEAKILGVKDIQAIVKGESPTDPKAFIGTGVLRGNRGIIFVDELPAIPTKVQVLFHPMLQENKIILEEYAWEKPVDIFFIATGNPSGFAHVNRIPEPLLDRLELIPMDLPGEPVERDIMFKESFKVYDDFFEEKKKPSFREPVQVKLATLKRRAEAPWWIVDVIIKTTRHTRNCPSIDRGASIRGSIKALDHTLSSTEMRQTHFSTLEDAAEGLKLALRGRIRLRADLIGFDDDPSEVMMKTGQIVEDVMWYAVRDVGARLLKIISDEITETDLAKDLNKLFSKSQIITEEFYNSPVFTKVLDWVNETSPIETPQLADGYLNQIINNPKSAEPKVVEEYKFSIIEFVANALITSKIVGSFDVNSKIFVPKRMEA